MSKLITIFGSTGVQGGSVIKHILADAELSKEFKIRGITRDVSKPSSKALEKQGVEMTTADMNSKASIVEALKGSHTVYLVTNYWETADAQIEISQGRNVADAAKELGVSFIIFSSLINVTKATNGRLKHVTHFDTKSEIEQYIRSTGVPCAFVLPGYYMSNYKTMLTENDDGVYTLAYPVSTNAQFPLFDAAEDTGKYVKAILKSPERLAGKRVFAAADYYTPDRIVAEFAEVTRRKTQYVQVSVEQYKTFLPPAAAQEFAENQLLCEEPGYYAGAGLQESLALLGDERPVSWKEFVKKTF